MMSLLDSEECVFFPDAIIFLHCAVDWSILNYNTALIDQYYFNFITIGIGLGNAFKFFSRSFSNDDIDSVGFI